MQKYLVSDFVNNRLDFVSEYEKISHAIEDKFAELISTGAIKNYYEGVIKKYHLTDDDLKHTQLIDYLTEDANASIQIGNKKYSYPKFLHEIIDDITLKAVSHFSSLSFKQNASKLAVQTTNLDLKFDFHYYYVLKLRKTLSKFREKFDELIESNTLNPEIGRPNAFHKVIVTSDKTQEDFVARQIRSSVLLACLNKNNLQNSKSNYTK